MFRYNESVIFNIPRVGSLRWQPSRWACPHSEARSEKYRDYSKERRAQRGEGHQESGAHCSLQLYAVVKFRRLRFSAASGAVIRRSAARIAIRRNRVSNTTCLKLSNQVSSFGF